MTTKNFIEKKMDNLLHAIKNDLILKNDAYNQFVGYIKAFAELGIITNEEAKQYRLQIARILFQKLNITNGG